MGGGSNGQGSSGGNGGKGGNPQGKSHLDLALRTLQRARSACIDYKEDPEPGETLRFIEKGFDVTPSPVAGPQPYGGNKRSRTMMHARGVKLHKKSQERWGPDAR